MRAPVGMEASVAPEVTPVTTRPPAAVNAVLTGSPKKRGWPMVRLIRQAARLTANKPYKENFKFVIGNWRVYSP